MKKLMFVSVFCLLSATTAFGSFKDTIKKAADNVKHGAKNVAHETKKFVDRNINSEKVEKTAEDTKEAVKDAAHDTKEGIKNAADETKKFVDRNINSEKVEKTAEDTKEAVKDAAHDTKEGIKNAADETKKFVDRNINSEKVEKTVDDTKEAVKDAAHDTKEGIKNAADETKKFVDRNINSEKVEKTVDDTKEAVKDAVHDTKEGIKNAADETKKFVDRNINSDKVKKTAEDTKEAVKDAAEKTEDFVKNLSKSEGKKPGQHMHHLKYARVNTILENFEETVTTAYDNAVAYTLPLEHPTLANSANSAKANIINFIGNYASVIEHLQSTKTDPDAFYLPTNIKSSTKPGDFGMTDSDYADMCDNYNLFITSCMYLTILQDIAMHGKSDCINSMGKKHYMLNQLADLMELQSSALSQKKLALKTDL